SLHGGSGNDTLYGEEDNDWLYAGIGNDTIDGGTGYDTAVFVDDFANYTIDRSGSTLTVTHNDFGSDGIDTVRNIEYLQFADRIITSGQDSTAGISVSAPFDLLYEGGQTTSYSVVLLSAPEAAVTVNLNAPDGLLLSESELIFTADNWNQVRTVEISVPDDTVDSGLQSMRITHQVVSADMTYNVLVPDDVNVTVLDDDHRGVLAETALSGLSEGELTQVSFSLSSQPADPVVLTLSADNRLALAASELTFTPENWNVIQFVEVTAPEDEQLNTEEVQTLSIMVSSDDSQFDGISVTDVLFTVADNDVPSSHHTVLSVTEDALQTDGFFVADGSDAGREYSYELTSQPDPFSAQVVNNGDGSFSLLLHPDVQAMQAGDSQVLDFTYTALWNEIASQHSVQITVNGMNDAPQAGNAQLSVNEGSTSVFGLLPGSDPDTATTLRYQFTSVPALSDGQAMIVEGNRFQYDSSSAGRSLAAGESRDIQLSYQVIDEQDAVSDEGIVTISLQGVNDAPVAAADTVLVDAGSELELAAILLENDSDPDATAILHVAEIDNSLTQGSVVYNADSHSVHYTADAATHDSLPVGEAAADRFSYRTVDDQGALSDWVNVDITVSGIQQVSADYDLAGVISFWGDSAQLIKGAEVSLLQNGESVAAVISDSRGAYAFSDLAAGEYALSLEKSSPASDDYIAAVSAADASVAARLAVGLVDAGSEYQKFAADVDGNGVISAADASMIARQAVGLIQLGGWNLVPEFTQAQLDQFTNDPDNSSNTLPETLSNSVSLDNDMIADYTAILSGDVDGSWTATLEELNNV
ncbi:MAG: Ig-like domain-containing protein, partial [Pontibacterium sp.]